MFLNVNKLLIDDEKVYFGLWILFIIDLHIIGSIDYLSIWSIYSLMLSFRGNPPSRWCTTSNFFEYPGKIEEAWMGCFTASTILLKSCCFRLPPVKILGKWYTWITFQIPGTHKNYSFLSKKTRHYIVTNQIS